jgi:hypothetical protein
MAQHGMLMKAQHSMPHHSMPVDNDTQQSKYTTYGTPTQHRKQFTSLTTHLVEPVSIQLQLADTP